MSASVERVAQHELDAPDVVQVGRLLERPVHQFTAHDSKPVLRATRCVERAALGACRDDRRRAVDEALADAPVLVEEVAEIDEVHAELEGVPSSGW
ncbi:MAG TPA: hypothetical protein PLH72_06715 [Vicinamibacterales bacterium]|nr:hypothetical protein [Vicinamibacterales bacterium]